MEKINQVIYNNNVKPITAVQSLTHSIICYNSIRGIQIQQSICSTSG